MSPSRCPTSKCPRRHRIAGRRSLSRTAWSMRWPGKRWPASMKTCAPTSPGRPRRWTRRCACCCSRRSSPRTTSATTSTADGQALRVQGGGRAGERHPRICRRGRAEAGGRERGKRVLRLPGGLPAPGRAAVRGSVRRLGADLPHASVAVGHPQRRAARHRGGAARALRARGRERRDLRRRPALRARRRRAVPRPRPADPGKARRARAARGARSGRRALPPGRPGAGFFRSRCGPRRVHRRARRAHLARRLHAEEGRGVRLGRAARGPAAPHRERALPRALGAAAHQRRVGAARARGRAGGRFCGHAPAFGAYCTLSCVFGGEMMFMPIRVALSALVIGCLQALGATAAEPVKLVVGYQPYDTISYSAVVIRALDLWKKHLPPGSEVEFQSALQGSIIVNQMLANKQQIGYLGDMPAVVVTTKRSVAPVNLVANTGLSPGQRCNVIMVRADAPKFNSPQEAVRWLDGKTLATPQGSCAHRFLGLVIEKTKIKPAQILNQSIEVIATNLRAGKIDGAVLWEPSVSRIGDIVGEGSGRIVATGHTFGIPDAGAIAMREDFIKARPDIVEAWLRTELEAQQFVLDPKNWTRVAEFVKSQTAGISVPMAWFS